MLPYRIFVLRLFSLLLILLLVGGCATRTAQQKKTSWYKRHSGGKTVPCPCDR